MLKLKYPPANAVALQAGQISNECLNKKFQIISHQNANEFSIKYYVSGIMYYE